MINLFSVQCTPTILEGKSFGPYHESSCNFRILSVRLYHSLKVLLENDFIIEIKA